VRARTWLLAAALGALAVGAAAEPAVEVRAELAPDPVGLDEHARLTLVVQSSGFGLPEIEPGFLLDNLEGSGGPSRAQSASWVNGQATTRLELTWRLRPVAVGKARVHEMRVAVGEEIRSLPELEVTVVERAPPGRSQPPAARPADPFARLFEDDPFGLFPRRRQDDSAARPKLALRSLVEPAAVRVGEQTVWTLALDTQTDISGFRPRTMPEFAGFWARAIELPERPRPEWVEVAGERFGRVAMERRALFPLRAGAIPIEPITVDVVARLVDAGWAAPLGRDERYELATRPLTVAVRPLPPGPREFSGLVGALALAAAIDPVRLDAGQAATLVVRATTDGNAQGISPPEPALPSGLRAFPPATITNERVEGGRLVSEIEWRYVVLADRAGEHEIPPVEIVHFDPARDAYAVARTAAVRLAVRAATPPAAEPASPAPPVAPAASPVPDGLDAALSPGFAVGFGLLAVVALAAGLVARRRRVAAPIRRLRAELTAAREAPSPREAAKALDEAWRRALAERHGISRSAPVAEWRSALAGAGWREERIRELEQLHEEMQLLEFAPELADAAALRRDLERRAAELARRLR
jgi:hypothetical protein